MQRSTKKVFWLSATKRVNDNIGVAEFIKNIHSSSSCVCGNLPTDIQDNCVGDLTLTEYLHS